MKQLYVHIGTHKTGTTSIQHSLRELSFSAPEELFYVEAPAEIQELRDLFEVDDKLAQKLRKELKKQIELVPENATAVLSNESLCGSPLTGYANAVIAAQMLYKLVGEYSPKIVVYLRRQDDFLESVYSQHILEGGSMSFDEYRAALDSDQVLNYDRLTTAFEKLFGEGNLIVRSYHNTVGTGLLSDFGRSIGVHGLEASAQFDLNPSYSALALQIARKCNPRLDSAAQETLRDALLAVMPKPVGDRFTYFSDEQRAAFLADFAETNALVRKRYLGESEALFPEPVAMTKVVELVPETVDPIVDLIVLLLQTVEDCQQEQKKVKKILGLFKRPSKK